MKVYPAVGGEDDLTKVLEEWEANHTASCTVISLLDDDKA